MGVGSISNKDNANPKQLKWEMKRGDFGGRPNGKKNFSKHKKFDGRVKKQGGKSTGSIQKKKSGGINSKSKPRKMSGGKKNFKNSRKR